MPQVVEGGGLGGRPAARALQKPVARLVHHASLDPSAPGRLPVEGPTARGGHHLRTGRSGRPGRAGRTGSGDPESPGSGGAGLSRRDPLPRSWASSPDAHTATKTTPRRIFRRGLSPVRTRSRRRSSVTSPNRRAPPGHEQDQEPGAVRGVFSTITANSSSVAGSARCLVLALAAPSMVGGLTAASRRAAALRISLSSA